MLASKILIPVDGSPVSLRALNYAIKMATQNPGSSFVLLNVQNVSATSPSLSATWLLRHRVKRLLF
jgi:nucleotide-binding universal stress UspA family protein